MCLETWWRTNTTSYVFSKKPQNNDKKPRKHQNPPKLVSETKSRQRGKKNLTQISWVREFPSHTHNFLQVPELLWSEPLYIISFSMMIPFDSTLKILSAGSTLEKILYVSVCLMLHFFRAFRTALERLSHLFLLRQHILAHRIKCAPSLVLLGRQLSVWGVPKSAISERYRMQLDG